MEDGHLVGRGGSEERRVEVNPPLPLIDVCTKDVDGLDRGVDLMNPPTPAIVDAEASSAEAIDAELLGRRAVDMVARRGCNEDDGSEGTGVQTNHLDGDRLSRLEDVVDGDVAELFPLGKGAGRDVLAEDGEGRSPHPTGWPPRCLLGVELLEQGHPGPEGATAAEDNECFSIVPTLVVDRDADVDALERFFCGSESGTESGERPSLMSRYWMASKRVRSCCDIFARVFFARAVCRAHAFAALSTLSIWVVTLSSMKDGSSSLCVGSGSSLTTVRFGNFLGTLW